MAPEPPIEELARAVGRALEREQRPAIGSALAELGEPDPLKATESLLRAAQHPDLGPQRERWLGSLLCGARPGYGAQCLDELATRYRQTRHRPLDLAAVPSAPRVLASSDFLARLLLRHSHWVEELAGDLPAAPASACKEVDWSGLRIAKYQGLLRIAARDLCGRSFEQSLRELSELADGCLAAGLACAARETGIEPPSLLALGKLGGRELNFSSDVDLLFVYEAPQGEPDAARNREVTRLIQRFKSHLEAPSEDGFGYRVDLDLRPEGRTGALANSVQAALHYYETFGADWERQMLIRLRPLAGPPDAARAFAREVEPFVYRTLIDPSSIRAVRDMKARIEADRRHEGHDLEHDLKEGPGGIRDVEFLVQALQLFHGGHHPELRTGNVLEGLAALEGLRLLPPAVTASLRDAYLWLRRAEHALQLAEERQTQRFPRERGAEIALARRMGYADASGQRARDRLRDDWTSVRAEVRDHFEALVLEGGPGDVR